MVCDIAKPGLHPFIRINSVKIAFTPVGQQGNNRGALRYLFAGPLDRGNNATG